MLDLVRTIFTHDSWSTHEASLAEPAGRITTEVFQARTLLPLLTCTQKRNNAFNITESAAKGQGDEDIDAVRALLLRLGSLYCG